MNQNSNSQPPAFKWSDESFCTLTIEECERLFGELYENNIDHFADNKDKLSLLRSCIELLNRLEGTTHNLFAGRVLVFLAKVIPLLDASGMNQKSEFNSKELPQRVVENLSRISEQNAEKDKNVAKLINQDMEEGETLSDEESNGDLTQDDSEKIYERFWKVQKFLYQPNLLYDKSNCYTFRTHVDTLLCKMEGKPTTMKLWNLNKSYMSELKALSLQFSDVNMRRCFLVQILIVIQYLELPVESKLESYTLDKVQLSWFSSVTKRIYGLLDTTPNPEEGRKFLTLMRFILRREEMWNRWKNDKCKEPRRPVEDDDEIINMRGTYHKRRKVSDELISAKPYSMHVIGSQEMTRLWNMKTSEKFNTPELEKYLNIPEEKQAECFKDPNYSFRVLRLLRKSPHFFGQSSAVIVSLDEYLKIAATRHMNKVKS